MRRETLCLGLLVLALFEPSMGLPKQNPSAPAGKPDISSQDSKAGFGRPAIISGSILMVKPEEGIVVLAVHGASQPPSTDIVVHQKTIDAGAAAIRESETTTLHGPGETDFGFRVTSSTLIKVVDGKQIAFGELATLEGREATVRFVPRRAGNFALGIEVG